MNEEQAIEQLPWLLNGTLSEDETAEVRRWIEDSARVRAEWERTRQAWDLHATEPPVEDLVAYVEGELDEDDRARIAAHLERSEAARQEEALLRQGKALVEAVDAGTVTLATRRQRPPAHRLSSPRVWRPALAAAVLASIAASLFWWLAFRSISPAPTDMVADGSLNVPIVEVLSATSFERGDGTELPSVELTTGENRMVLILVSEEDPGPVPLELDAEDSTGQVFWTATGLERDPRGEYTVSLAVPTAVDQVTLRIYAQEGTGRREVDRYALRIERSEAVD